jgi:protein ImuA
MTTAQPTPTDKLRADLARLVLPNSRLRAPQPLLDGRFALMRGRVHEFCGPARVNLAAFVLQATSGAVIWAGPSWLAERVYPYGLMRYCDPNRIIFARCRRPEDIFWTMEEALRSGAAPLVLADMPKPPALTPIRRLHLAAEAGAEVARARARPAPLGVILTPQMGGAQGVESRWHLAAAPSRMTALEMHAAWVLQRLRARDAAPASWGVARAKGQYTITPRQDMP